MQSFTLILATFLLIQLSWTLAIPNEEWYEFKNTFNRSYNSEGEEHMRFEIFHQNLEIIQKHNELYDQGLSSYQLGINQFADWTRDEFRKLIQRNPSNKFMREFRKPSTQIYTDNDLTDLPDEIDWTKKGVVTAVRNMGDCGSGYAFGPVQALESQQALKTGKLVELSVQQVIDCSTDENYGCQGGLIDFTLDYILRNHGQIDTEASYPYVGPNGTGCHFSVKTVGAVMKSLVDLKRFDEQVMQNAVAKVGPVAISIDADSPHFMLYKSGVYDYDDCNMILIDHGMTVVGYGTLNGKQYWKIKNSMSTSWGMDGYVLWARNKDNLCGVASTPCYPLV
ncbi:cathepsin L-like peptidase [Dermatophagoides pteronyssinus]|uniref:cathepsin L-like peptidase n=1 Tax=Dermatophagoides pteronyssinus TaxID=6956 RepID=UPI003F677090